MILLFLLEKKKYHSVRPAQQIHIRIGYGMHFTREHSRLLYWYYDEIKTQNDVEILFDGVKTDMEFHWNCKLKADTPNVPAT